MSILSKLSKLNKANTSAGRTPMSVAQVAACKAAIVRDNRGYSVQPNQFDLAKPYRVSVRFNKEAFGKPANSWHNFGDFVSADVAAGVGTIISQAFFGENAKAGCYDLDVVEASEEFKSWMEDERNADVILACNQGGLCETTKPVANSPDVDMF